MSLDLTTYITKKRSGVNRKLYRTTCDKCEKETAYQDKARYIRHWKGREHLCPACSATGKTIANGRKPPVFTKPISGSNHYKWNGGKPNCIDCGKEIYHGQQRCKECNKKFSVGENAANYKGNNSTTPITKLIRTYVEYIDWIKAVLKRDNYTCQYTGQYGGKLHVHHLVPLASIIREAKLLYTDKVDIIKYVLSKHTLDIGITVSKEYHYSVIHYKKAG